MEVDKKYCMSSFLMYRAIVDETKCFTKEYIPSHFYRVKHFSKCHTYSKYSARTMLYCLLTFPAINPQISHPAFYWGQYKPY